MKPTKIISKNLNIGCGPDVKSGFVNLDARNYPGVDVIQDLNKFPYAFADNAFDYIYARNVLEHLTDLVKVMEELHRISNQGAKIDIIVPFYNNHNAFRDITHIHFFTLDSFLPFSDSNKDGYIYSTKKFKIIKKILKPSAFGKIIPRRLLNIFAITFGNLAEEIEFQLEVIK
jgi:ubiquinone/menaquinone biosynthesis C-methylase UbiE